MERYTQYKKKERPTLAKAIKKNKIIYINELKLHITAPQTLK